MSSENSARLILGIDLGVKSVGLALLDVQQQKIIHTACRVFPAPIEDKTDFSKGTDASRAIKRREMRLQRRQTDRRRRRQQNVYRLLQQHGLLPSGPAHETLRDFDQQLALKYGPHPGAPYILRAKALTDQLELDELGRAIYHLSQHRGFLSNRRSPVKKDEDAGKVDSGIGILEGNIKTTLGAYLAAVDPPQQEMRTRIRGRYTSRKMYLDEFESIWAEQEKYHHDILTPKLKSELHEAIFYQRPLKDQKEKIGKCSLTLETRIPKANLLFQEFRILQTVNGFRLVDPPRVLTEDERNILISALQKSDLVEYKKIKRILNLPEYVEFNFERSKKKSIQGNITNVRFSKVLGEKWNNFSDGHKQEIVDCWWDSLDNETLKNNLINKYHFTNEEADKVCKISLEKGYANFSISAIEKLLPLLKEKNLSVTEAIEEVFPDQPVTPLNMVPPVLEALPGLQGPVVIRALTELRKCVNEIIRRFGKPDKIHIELARDLKRSKEKREAIASKNNKQERKRTEIKKILQEHDVPNPSRADIEKYILWEECKRTCPYSGRIIVFWDLFGPSPIFDFEHIIPYSRSFDNSFDNKTLCLKEYNARKLNMTPWEAFGKNQDEWESMVERVRKFGNKSKLRRFMLQEADTKKLLKQFSSNQLNDTRYASKLAAKYLGTLYGGVNVKGKENCIIPCAGEITAILRRFWKLDGILSPIDYRKSREDHRHHTIDAATVALASPRLIQLLSQETIRAELAGQRKLRSFEDPWSSGFKDQLHEAIHQRTVVSHRPVRKLQGPLHKETLYGRPREDKEGKCWVHIRTPVKDLTAKDFENIVDPTVRKRLLGGHKTLESGVPINSVRIRESMTTVVIGSGFRERNVATKNNHHMTIFEKQEGKKKTYIGRVVSLLEAMDRFRNKVPVVNKNDGPDSEFLFSLSEGDMVMYGEELWRVRGVTHESNGRLKLSRANDARLDQEIAKTGDLRRPSVNQFCSSGGRKVTVSPLGEIRDAHD